MRPKQIIVTSGNSPVTIPVNWRSGESGIVTALPAGVGNYTVASSNDNVYDPSITPTYTNVVNMTAATAQVSQAYDTGITALKVTLHSGTSVTITVSQDS
jgi:hypothetical protein